MEDSKAMDLNTVETEEYQQWLNVLKGVCAIQTALKENPNSKGLKQARSAAYNVLADIQMLTEALEDQKQHAA